MSSAYAEVITMFSNPHNASTKTTAPSLSVATTAK